MATEVRYRDGMTAKMSVIEDRATRVIIVKIDIEPGDRSRDLEDFTATWRTKPRPFVPAAARILIEGGELRTINVSGPLRLKSGGIGVASDSMTWYAYNAYRGSSLKDAPEWVRLLAVHTAQGVTSWEFPEVQAL